MKQRAIVPASKAGFIILAGEAGTYALLGAAQLQAAPRFFLSLAAGAAAVLACSMKERRRRRSVNPAGMQKEGEQENPAQKELFPNLQLRTQTQLLQTAAELAAQLEADARRLSVKERAEQGKDAARLLGPVLQNAAEQAEAAQSALQQLKGCQKTIKVRMDRAGQKRKEEYGAAAQELAQMAFQANLLALHLQRAGESSGKAAAQGLRLLAARCSRCEKKLSGWKSEQAACPEDGELSRLVQQAQERTQQTLQALQKGKAAECTALRSLPKERQMVLSQSPSAQLAAGARALLELLRGEEPEAAEKEGVIPGTALHYRRVE